MPETHPLRTVSHTKPTVQADSQLWTRGEGSCVAECQRYFHSYLWVVFSHKWYFQGFSKRTFFFSSFYQWSFGSSWLASFHGISWIIWFAARSGRSGAKRIKERWRSLLCFCVFFLLSTSSSLKVCQQGIGNIMLLRRHPSSSSIIITHHQWSSIFVYFHWTSLSLS